MSNGQPTSLTLIQEDPEFAQAVQDDVQWLRRRGNSLAAIVLFRHLIDRGVGR
jgi:hypothetical protein